MPNRNLVSASNFIITNPGLDTVLSGRVWKGISIIFDLENVGIELYHTRDSLAFLAFIKSSFIYESFSDGSKLVDLVSNEIILTDTRKISSANWTRRASFCQSPEKDSESFYNVLSKKFDGESNPNSNKRLQLELHFRSNKKSQRYSILFNSCRVITIVDWLIEMKSFLTSNMAAESVTQRHQPTPVLTRQQKTPAKEELPVQVKLNLANTDFVLIENLANMSSQAIILRLTAFFEYNPAKTERPVESCLQSFELFSCQMNAIEETALSIIDPVMFNIYLKLKNSSASSASSSSAAAAVSTASSAAAGLEYVLDVSTDVFRLRFSYLDFNLFIKVIESVRKQFELKNRRKERTTAMNNGESNGQILLSTTPLPDTSVLNKLRTFPEVDKMIPKNFFSS